MATLLFRKAKPVDQSSGRTAIIDIGSNSIRLVVYEGPPRLPATLFNEKVMAGLGRGLAKDGAIDPEGMALGRMALGRFAAMAREMEVTTLRTVATAAVREASNGPEFLAHARKLGLEVELLSGEQEAAAAGMGVLSAIPDADGIVGDLGGGSLELVRIRNGEIGERVSFPLGVLRVAAIRAKGKGNLDRRVGKLIADAGWAGRGKGLPFYLVGGSWRSLARLDMWQRRYPLPIIHQYCMAPETIQRLHHAIPHMGKTVLREVPSLSNERIPTLGDAAALLTVLLKHLDSASTVVSAFGLREGLLYGKLEPGQRSEDPLIAAARDEGERLGRFAEHGDLLDRWIAPAFAAEGPGRARIRHAACLLADVGWHANPEFRAERGLEVALHGNWVALDACERALMAQALFTALGGGAETPAPLGRLANAADLKRATAWGLAMRLGQRLSGGLAGPLQRSRLTLADGVLGLHLAADDQVLYSDTVERRHATLAEALDAKGVLLV